MVHTDIPLDKFSQSTYVEGQESAVEAVVPSRKESNQVVGAHGGKKKKFNRDRKPDTQRRKGKKRNCKGFDASLEDWTLDSDQLH